MKQRTAGLICLLAVFFIGDFAFGAIDTAPIDKVIKKDVLDQQDLAVIDGFVAAGVQEILKTTDFSSISNLRADIVARANSGKSPQYNPQFIAAAQKNLEKAFADAQGIADPNQQAGVETNLMILLDNLSDIKLVNIALKMIDDKNVAVRYWAVHAATNPNFVGLFNAGKAPASIARNITEQLAGRIKVETSPYIVEQIVLFAATTNVPQAKDLFARIVDERLQKYQSFTVKRFSIDGTVLKLLGDQIAAQDKAAAKQFGQLYSYTIEYYLDYLRGKIALDAAQKERLAAVLVQTESHALVKLGFTQTSIKKALEKKDKEIEPALLAAYKELFGDGQTPGKFSTVLNVTYTNPDGTKRVTPLPLPEPEKPKPATGS